MKNYTFLIAAGGTGGHLFPAVAVVEKLSSINPNFTFHFTGRSDKIEANVVKSLGYQFHPIEIEGLRKIFSLKNLIIPFKIFKSKNKIKKIIKKNKIDAVIATGGYISFPPSVAASKLGVPLFLMESNYNPGKSINMLASKASILFTSFPETESFFEQKKIKKIVYSGNPVRNIFSSNISKEEAKQKLGFDSSLPVLFVFGGSLGSQAINESITSNLEEFLKNNIQILWQTGDKFDEGQVKDKVFFDKSKVKNFKFINDMATAYSAADLVVCRSGASTMSEISIMGKPSILVPLLIGGNREQEYNAKYFEKNGASVVIPQSSLMISLKDKVIEMISNQLKLKEMEASIKKFAKPDASEIISKSIIDFLDKIKN